MDRRRSGWVLVEMERRTIGLSMLFVHAHGLEGGGAGDHFVAEGGLVVGLVVPVDLVVGILPVVCVRVSACFYRRGWG